MGKIVKTLQQKHKETLSPWLKEYVARVAEAPLPKIPQLLAEFPMTWPYPRGDLYHWIPLLNRFDNILECFCSTYQLADRPQDRDFTREILLNKGAPVEYCDEAKWTEADLANLGYGEDGDSHLIISVLKFSSKLLEHCGNRSIYSSSSHLNSLLHSTSFPVLRATLQVGMELAQRYQASVKRMSHTPRAVGAALLASHYNIDLERVQHLAQPFVKTPIIGFTAEPITPATPGSANAKGKEKATQVPAAKNAAPKYANDLASLAVPDEQGPGFWAGWGDVKVTYYPKLGSQPPASTVPVPQAAGERAHANMPSTPTPLRRSSTMGSQQRTPRGERASADDAASPISPFLQHSTADEGTKSPQMTFELPQSAVMNKPMHELISRCPEDMPEASRYEVLNRLRVARALLASSESRQDALSVRLLAITNLSYIHPETYFMEKVLRQDNDEPRRYQLVYQLADLIHPVTDGKPTVPIWLQTIALKLLHAISNFHTKHSDVLSALNANVNHGVLLYVIRKAVAGMREGNDDSPDSEESEANDWREALFALTLHMSVSARFGTEMIGAGIMDNLVEILDIRTNVAERFHGTALNFLDALIYTFQGAFQSFVDAKGLDRISELTVYMVTKATEMTEAGKGTPANLRTSTVDYEIPYYQQQTLKWLLKFIHHIMTSWYSFGGNTDRLLRNLVDDSKLLLGLRHIIENMGRFGSVVWTNAMIIISDFINNDPTSFAALMESGLIKSFLESITGRELSPELCERPSDTASGSTAAPENNADVAADMDDSDHEDDSSPEPRVPLVSQDNSRPHPPTKQMLESRRVEKPADHILPSSEAMQVIPGVLNSISLNNIGIKMVVSSGAIESYLQIFESPRHLQTMESEHEIAANIGGSFDELARHHPALRPVISNAVLDMVAYVCHLGKEKATTSSWGVHLLVPGPSGDDLVADESILIKAKPDAPSSEDIEMVTGEPSKLDATHEEREQTVEAITPYVHAVSNFLSTYTGNNSLKRSFTQKGGIELLLDMVEMPSLPHDFADSQALKVLQHVISLLVEQCPIIGLPSLLNRAQAAVDALEPLIKHQGDQTFFEPFVRTDLSLKTQSGEWDDQGIKRLAQGTKVVRALLTTQSLVKTLYNCLPQSSRQQSMAFLPVNVFDYYARLIQSLGPLLQAVLVEEMTVAKAVPAHWPHNTPLLGARPPVVESGTATTVNQISETLGAATGSVSATNPATGTSTPNPAQEVSKKPIANEETKSAAYKNFQVLQGLLHSVVPTSYPFFQSLGKALLPRRERDAWIRSQHLWIAEMLAMTVSDQLKVARELSVKDLHYWAVMLHSVDEMLTDTPRHGDRSTVQVIIPVLLAFKSQGGFDSLHLILSRLADKACSEPLDSSDASPRLAQIGMKKILDLYLTVVTGKRIIDSVNLINIARAESRRDANPIASQLVVELRASILPVIRKIWESDKVEKLEAGVVNKILEILRAISLADEESAAPRATDKEQSTSFKREAVPFDWSAQRALLSNLTARHKGEDIGLIREAVYRAHGVVDLAEEYLSAHKANLAGPRNPIPQQDAYQEDSAPGNTAVSDSETIAQPQTRPEGDDAMVIDPVPGEVNHLVHHALRNELAERPPPASQNNDGDDASPALETTQEASTNPSSTIVVPPTAAEEPSPAKALEDLTSEREKLRDNLIERCLDVIRAHPGCVYDVSMLIRLTIFRQEDKASCQEIGETLANALVSFDIDIKSNSVSIAAYAHLLSMLLQESESFFQSIQGTLRDNVEMYLSFLKVSGDELPSWMPYILLILEILLLDDEQPVKADWSPPGPDDETISNLILHERESNISLENRQELLNSILDILPRVGKDPVLSVAVLRLLQILTRAREFAQVVGEKKNLQRLFALARQVAPLGSVKLKETKISSYIMTILRHIVEDDETVQQIMRYEIRHYFASPQRNGIRSFDLNSYLKALAHVSLRNPKLFIEVTQEMVKITQWRSEPPEAKAKVYLALKPTADPSTSEETAKDDSVEPAVQQATQDLNINDVKPSTESADKEMTDAPRTPGSELKRPIVENPDGVINFLLDQLLSHQKVEDIESTSPATVLKDTAKDAANSASITTGLASSEASPVATPTLSPEQTEEESKDNKQAKQQFKVEEHPMFIYRCFLLHCLSELLHGYTRTKIEFINFKRGAPLLTNTPVKPRSSVLNYLLNDLICLNSLQPQADTLAYKKKAATAEQARLVLVALVSKTAEKPSNRLARRFEPSDDKDLNFVRKFVLDTILRAYRDASSSIEPFDTRYAKLQSLAELMYCMIDDKEVKDPIVSRPGTDDSLRTHAQLRRLMYEKGYIHALTSSIADVDLTFPGVKRTIRHVLRVVHLLTTTGAQLSHEGVLPPNLADGLDDEILSASSLSDMDEEREETPDLYRNSSLGMLEPREDDDFSNEDSDDDDEDMYDDGYPEEMEYDEDMSQDDEENVSDEDEEIDGMGHVEGLSGDAGVVEVIMGDDDDDESMDDDEEDTSDDDDDQDIDVEPFVEAIEEMEMAEEMANGQGNIIEDDGASEWESESDSDNDDENDEDEDDDQDEIDYEGEAQDIDEARLHGLEPGQLSLGNYRDVVRAMGPDILDDFAALEGRFGEEDEVDDDEEDDEDDIDEDVFVYDYGGNMEGGPPPPPPDGLGWDSLIEHPAGGHRHRPGIRSPFPITPNAVVIGGPGDRMGDFRNFYRPSPRGAAPQAPANGDDMMNPLLRRAHGAREASPRPVTGGTLRFPFPLGYNGIPDNPMSFLSDLLTHMPQNLAASARAGGTTHLQLQFSHEGPHGPVHEFHIPVTHHNRDPRNDTSRSRDIYPEPQHAVAFTPGATIERWHEEARMVFGVDKIQRLYDIIFYKLAPQAIAEEKELKAKEAEARKKIEDARKMAEAEARKRAEAEAEAKAARDKEEAERKAKEEREAAEAARAALRESQSESQPVEAEADTSGPDSQAMEGVEATQSTVTGSGTQSFGAQERVMTTIRGEEVDLTGLGIDPDYLAALPEEFREEVIAQTVTTRRSEARQQAENTGTGQEAEAFNEFLEALPAELRQEIIQQESHDRRRRERDESRRLASNNAPQDMDPASILLTFDAALREEILLDQGEELAEHLPADFRAQLRALQASHGASRTAARVRERHREAHREAVRASAGQPQPAVPTKPVRQPVPQMLDKAGVATLLRLMFISQPANLKSHHFAILGDVCENRQNRLDVISTILQILQDGSTNMDAVEKSFSHLSLKAKQPKDKDLQQKTPNSLKRSATSLITTSTIQHNSDVSPLMIVHHCLDLLVELCRNPHIPPLFLTEHETVGSLLKRSLNRKGKGKELKAHKYAINSLLSLLGRNLVMESSAVMQLLADLLNKVTYPLQALDRRRREAEEEAKKPAETDAPPTAAEPSAELASADAMSATSTSQVNENNTQPGAAVQTEEDPNQGEGSSPQNTKTAEKKPKSFQPPIVPVYNLTLVVNIFVARECSSKTFQNTISTIKNLSYIPGAKTVFGQELVRQARLLSENIVRDLEDLLPHILKAESGTEIQGVALNKFSPGASEQNKLLRVLTALDHLFDSKVKKTGEAGDSANKDTEKQEFISSLYYNSTFGTMWDKLSACLSAIHQRENMVNVATILLPLIESLMVVCKNTTLSEAPESQGSAKEMLLTSPPPEDRMAGLFFTFTEQHRRVLNELVRINPKLMSGTFSLLVKNPKVLEFDNKRNYFNRSVHAKTGNQTRPTYPPLQLSVRRDHVFHDSFKSLYFKKGEEMKYGKLNIRFHGEEGVDAGGVTREWFQVLSRQMFDPNYVLFIPVSSDRTTFHPNKLSSINDEHLMFFKFIGRIIGKALYEGRVLDCYFSRAVYKRILGKPVSVKDMESFDPEYYKSLVWMLENDITDIITENFAVEDDAFGVTKIVDLCENGRNIPVTDDNKHEYVRLVVEHKLLASVKDQMAEFLQGFHDIIPAELIAIFNEQELELLISGLPDIDVDDWKAYAEYHNYQPSSQQIQWFWRAVRSFDKEERAKLLQFVTGTSKVPLNGFKELEGMNGVSRFNIHRDYGRPDRLPSSHTCFNQLDLPEYESYDILRKQILKAITAGSDYFGFA